MPRLENMMPLPSAWDYTDPAFTPPDPEWWDETDIPIEYENPRHCPICGALAHTDPARCDEAYTSSNRWTGRHQE